MKRFAAIAGLTLAACAAAAPARLPDVRWPAPPEQARLVLGAVVSSPDDLGLKRPWYARMWDVVAGESRDDAFVNPFSVALREGWLAVGDTATGAVWLLNVESGARERIDAIDGLPLVTPVGLALTEQGVWIADAETGRVSLVDYEGDAVRTLRPASRPAGIAVDAAGRLAIAQPQAHRVVVVDPGGTQTELGGAGGGPGQFNFPTQVAFGPDGSLFVNDALNFRIQRFDAGLRYVSAFGARGDSPGFFGRARGIAVDAAMHVYVADALFDVVQIFDAQGALLLVVGGGGQGPGELWLPGGVAAAPGRLAVADTQNGRIQLLDLVGGAR